MKGVRTPPKLNVSTTRDAVRLLQRKRILVIIQLVEWQRFQMNGKILCSIRFEMQWRALSKTLLSMPLKLIYLLALSYLFIHWNECTSSSEWKKKEWGENNHIRTDFVRLHVYRVEFWGCENDWKQNERVYMLSINQLVKWHFYTFFTIKYTRTDPNTRTYQTVQLSHLKQSRQSSIYCMLYIRYTTQDNAHCSLAFIWISAFTYFIRANMICAWV